ncbi:hypothetical protein TNIN_359301 [Trichonephila inaurata madagascariensis]|uniref:NTF2 domain-containing protein n=1 Tax=Trichonephila inaurata madagascariensis TaxID=2747483 RepID=A0A8X6XBS2_9ARAC|nr:hypothetical protein TNIN_359301 [Trichonephila inaurata madagascariensis]
MRPFLQTVILVKQPSGKYYVSNDIFCYLDDIFPAEDNEDVDEDVVTDNCIEDTGEENSKNLNKEDDIEAENGTR